MLEHLRQFIKDDPLTFRGEPKDALRALCLMMLGIFFLLLSYGIFLLMWSNSFLSVKGIITVLLGPLLGGVLCLWALWRLLTTAIRFRMYGTLLLCVVALAGIAYGVGTQVSIRRAEGSRRDMVRRAFADPALVRSYLEIPGLQEKNLSDPYLKGSAVILLDEEIDYNGFPAPGLKIFADLAQVKSALRPDGAKWHDLIFDLPLEVQPHTPQDVQSIIWIKGIRKVVGIYGDPKRADDISPLPEYAYEYHATITLIDYSIPRIVGLRQIIGPRPPEKKRNSAEGEGTLPTEEIEKYLRELPRRPAS